MYSVFHYFSQKALLANIITIALLLLGASSLLSVNRDLLPSVSFGVVIITTSFPGASPADVELLVTNEIEDELAGIAGIGRYQSQSMEDASIISVQVDPDAQDEEKVIQNIREAVSRVNDLPAGVTERPLVSELGTSILPMIDIGIVGNLPYGDLRNIAKRLKSKLERTQGVAQVDELGLLAREISIGVSSEDLSQWNVSLMDIVTAIRDRNVRISGGLLEASIDQRNIITKGQFEKPTNVGDVIVKTSFDSPLVTLNDIAIIRDGFESPDTYSAVNGQSAIILSVSKTESADMIKTVDSIKQLMDAEQEMLPNDSQLVVAEDHSNVLRNRLSIVINNGLLGIILLLVVLSFFLGITTAFWTAIGVVSTFSGVLFLIPIFDLTLDSIILATIVLVTGIIVDDSIVISDSIYRASENGMPAIESAAQGMVDVYKPILTTVLTTIIVFSPLLFFPGFWGNLIFVIPLIVILSLLISLVEAFFILPAHLAHGLRKFNNDRSRRNIIFEKIINWYKKRLFFLLNIRYLIVFLFTGALAFAVYFAISSMNFVLFPSSSAERFAIFLATPDGTGLERTFQRAKEVENIVSKLQDSELVSFTTHVGTFGIIGSERSENAVVTVVLTPANSRDRTVDQIIHGLRTGTNKLEGLERILYRIDTGGPDLGRPVSFRIVGNDDDMRQRLADDMFTFLNTLDGVKDVDRDDRSGQQQIEIKPNFEMLARLGISVAELADNVRIAYEGEVVTTGRYDGENIDFRLALLEELRGDPESIKQLLLPNQGELLTPLGLLADLETRHRPERIIHFDGEPAINVWSDVDQNSITPIEVLGAVLEHFDVDGDYPGVRLVVDGEIEESQNAQRQFIVIIVMALIGIYLLMALLFNSLRQPLIILSAIPFGVLGVIIGFSFHDVPFGFVSIAGIVGLNGIVVNDALILLDHINKLKRQFPRKNIREIVVQGTSDRIRAVFLTTVSTVAGVMPLAYGFGGSDHYMGPMALALGWGLAFAMPLTLLLIPCLYQINEDIGRAFAGILRTR